VLYKNALAYFLHCLLCAYNILYHLLCAQVWLCSEFAVHMLMRNFYVICALLVVRCDLMSFVVFCLNLFKLVLVVCQIIRTLVVCHGQ